MLRAFAGLPAVMVVAAGAWIWTAAPVVAQGEADDAPVPIAADNPPITDPGDPIAHRDEFGAGTRLAASETAPSPAPPPKTGSDQAPAAGGDSAAQSGSPSDLAKSADKGSLKSPYADYASVAEEGHQKFMAAGCNGCHGGTGGGGMGPPLTNQVWVYGKDDDTLFRLIALGSDELQKQGYSRKGSENVVGPMPPMGGIVKSADDQWKIIAWIRSVNPSSASGSSAAVAPPVQ
jgi:mono/diheme cytochrome c family protein